MIKGGGHWYALLFVFSFFILYFFFFVYFLVATTSGFIQVACSRVQPRKVTIEKKDEINEYKKKRNTK
jgi:hypothetical protein